MDAQPPPAPGPREERLAGYLEGLAQAAGHRDRWQPLKSYCVGLLLPGERKSVEPMAARLAPDQVRRMHQSLHHLVANASWDDRHVLETVWQYVLPVMTGRDAVTAWIVDDTGFPKQGKHSVGVARQYCGQVGKQDNCQVAVSLSVSTAKASLPVAFDLYLPESWIADPARRIKTGVPEQIEFQTKPEIATDQIQRALEAGLPPAPVLADAAYGNDSKFRQALDEMGLEYLVGVQSSISLWAPGAQPLPPKPWTGKGRPPKLLRRDKDNHPISALELARRIPDSQWELVTWRAGAKRPLRSRFAVLRVRPAHRDYWDDKPHPERWLLIEWPQAEPEPVKYWLGSIDASVSLSDLVWLAKHRWIIERDYEELKQELGLGHFEGRGWRGFHHHATLCIAAYGFLVAERSRFSPSPRAGLLQLSLPAIPQHWKPRGSPPAP